jgi:hypothetical protein
VRSAIVNVAHTVAPGTYAVAVRVYDALRCESPRCTKQAHGFLAPASPSGRFEDHVIQFRVPSGEIEIEVQITDD